MRPALRVMFCSSLFVLRFLRRRHLRFPSAFAPKQRRPPFVSNAEKSIALSPARRPYTLCIRLHHRTRLFFCFNCPLPIICFTFSLINPNVTISATVTRSFAMTCDSSSSVRSDSLKPVHNRLQIRSRNTSCSRRRANRRWRVFLPHSCLINSAPSPRTSPRTRYDPFERLGGARGPARCRGGASRLCVVVVDTHTSSSSSLPVTFKIEHRS